VLHWRVFCYLCKQASTENLTSEEVFTSLIEVSKSKVQQPQVVELGDRLTCTLYARAGILSPFAHLQSFCCNYLTDKQLTLVQHIQVVSLGMQAAAVLGALLCSIYPAWCWVTVARASLFKVGVHI
jgi:hypothetical protein